LASTLWFVIWVFSPVVGFSRQEFLDVLALDPVSASDLCGRKLAGMDVAVDGHHMELEVVGYLFGGHDLSQFGHCDSSDVFYTG
jgi:hypothetical protein